MSLFFKAQSFLYAIYGLVLGDCPMYFFEKHGAVFL
jgi:hypothetical protein